MSTLTYPDNNECVSCGRETVSGDRCVVCDPENSREHCEECGEIYDTERTVERDADLERYPSVYRCGSCGRYRERDEWTVWDHEDCPRDGCPGARRIWLHDDNEQTFVESCVYSHETVHDAGY